MLKNNAKIKVVRKAEKAEPAVRKPVVKTARETARDMVSNVSDWVTDFKARKRIETKAAIEQLFPIPPRTNES